MLVTDIRSSSHLRHEGELEPPVWGVATAPVTITNPGTQSVRVDTVQTQAFNHTRASLINSNVRPNEDFIYGDTWVPEKGAS